MSDKDSKPPQTDTGGKKVRQKDMPSKEIIEEERERTPRQFKAPSGHEVKK